MRLTIEISAEKIEGLSNYLSKRVMMISSGFDRRTIADEILGIVYRAIQDTPKAGKEKK